MKNSLIHFVRKMNNPAFLVDQSGYILCLNDDFKNILKLKKLRVPNTMRDLDENFLSNIPYVHFERTIKLGDQKVKASIHGIKNNLDCINYIYMFDTFEKYSSVIDDVIEHIDEIVVIFDENGVIIKMNSICDEVLPFKRSNIMGKDINYIIDTGIVDETVINKVLKEKKKTYKNVLYSTGKIISYTGVPIWSKEGVFKGGVLTGRDRSRWLHMTEFMDIENSEEQNGQECISKSKVMDDIKNLVSRVAKSEASVFIRGESGVGKEIIARNIYKQSNRCDRPFVAINCGAIPSELLESELFGYEEGSFTGAKKTGKKGILEEADGGTVFLDEIGELPLQMQKKLLRVLQENTITRIGGIKSKKIDVRYISATNISDEEISNRDIFRQDLYYRLSVIPIVIPPLRERREDIPVLAKYFLKYFNKKYNRKIVVDEAAMKCLKQFDWYGNIRELKNIIERLVVISGRDVAGVDDIKMILSFEVGCQDKKEDAIIVNDIIKLEDAYQVVDQQIIQAAVKKYGSISRASEVIGINPSTVYRKIKNGTVKL